MNLCPRESLPIQSQLLRVRPVWGLVAALLLVPLDALHATDVPETAAGWKKFEGNPVMGGKYGTCFDISVLRDGDKYRMWLSWRPKNSVALVESADGIHWSVPPQVVLPPRKETGWEDVINRPYVLKKGDTYHMWYTGQIKPGAKDGHSWIGYATSPDGVTWKRMSDKPVLTFDQPWEKEIAVMCPSVLWNDESKQFQMWYSGGEQNEPNAIGYATSPDGLTWKKCENNPVFSAEPTNPWEKHKVAGVQVIKTQDWYLMFYIGYETEPAARICLARSKDGVTHWQRHPANPIIFPGKEKWDHHATYKPYAIFDGRKWLLWYNGRHDGLEQIGVVLHEGEDLGFDPPAPASAPKPKHETCVGPIPGPNVNATPGWQESASAGKDADGFVPLFDGNTFNGWEGNPKRWRIEDGAIVGGSLTKGGASEYICTPRDYTNFELRLQWKTVKVGTNDVNGGIQIRTRRLANTTQVTGYQADLGTLKGYRSGKFWGCLFDNTRRNKILAGDPVANEKLVRMEDWNDYVIRCEGPRIRLWLNGQPTADFTETDEKIPLTGIIGLQVHSGPPMEIWYRNIRLKELPGNSSAEPR